MLSEDKKSLSKVRLDLAKERLATAKMLAEYGDFKSAANRSYYAVFSAIRAVLALDGFDSKKHSGVIAEFRKLYIKTGLLDAELSYTINDLFEVRQSSDYNDFYVISKDDVFAQLQKAEDFLSAVDAFLTTQYSK